MEQAGPRTPRRSRLVGRTVWGQAHDGEQQQRRLASPSRWVSGWVNWEVEVDGHLRHLEEEAVEGFAGAVHRRYVLSYPFIPRASNRQGSRLTELAPPARVGKGGAFLAPVGKGGGALSAQDPNNHDQPSSSPTCCSWDDLVRLTLGQEEEEAFYLPLKVGVEVAGVWRDTQQCTR